jgi:hypothetical protein
MSQPFGKPKTATAPANSKSVGRSGTAGATALVSLFNSNHLRKSIVSLSFYIIGMLKFKL